MKTPLRLSLLLVLFLLLSAVVSATGGSMSGDGSSGDPWQVEDCKDLQNVGNTTAGYGLGEYYILTQNIDCDVAPYNSGVGFKPIGSVSPYFSGNFNGQDHVISGLHIDRNTTDRVGLFARAAAGVRILNVGLNDAVISGDEYVGGLVGYFYINSYDALINNSFVDGNIYGTYVGTSGRVGGLVGASWSGNITNCHSSGHIYNTGAFSGGLIGAISDTYVDRCYSSANVTGDYGDLGGLIGGASASGTAYYYITNCNASGVVNGTDDTCIGGFVGTSDCVSIINCSATGDVYGPSSVQRYIAGFVGDFAGDSGNRAYLNNSYSTGDVIASGDYIVGGFVGDTEYANFSQCYATGNVFADYRAGGFFGYGGGSTSKSMFLNCFSRGNLSISSSTSQVGGFGGSQYPIIENCYSTGDTDDTDNGFFGDSGTTAVCTNCFWDTETSGASTSVCSATGKTTAEMKTESTFTDAGWDFTDVWGIDDDINSGYPYLRSLFEPSALAVTWNWADMDSIIGDDFAHQICVNTNIEANCTLDWNGTDVANSSSGTSACFYRNSLSDGNYSAIKVRCEDASNVKANSTLAWLAVDTSGSGLSWSSRVNFTSSVASTSLLLASSEAVNCTLVINGTRIVNTSTATSISWNLTNYAEGNWSFYATCDDSVGNNANSSNAWWMVDQTPPTLSWGWTVNTSSSSYPTPIITADEGLYACKLNISGTNYSMTQRGYFSFEYAWSPAVGTYWLRGYCNDSANNSATTTLAWFEKTQSSGGGSSCSKEWDCTDWSDCDGGEQTRTCKCDCLRDKDCYGSNDETRSCTVEEIEIIIEEEPEEDEEVIIVGGDVEVSLTLRGVGSIGEVITIELSEGGAGVSGSATITTPKGESFTVEIVAGSAEFTAESPGTWTVSYVDSTGRTISKTIGVAGSMEDSNAEGLESTYDDGREIETNDEEAEDLTGLLLVPIVIVVVVFIVFKLGLFPQKPAIKD